MLTSILTLFVLLLAVRGALFLLRQFWTWLGRGKDLDDAIDHRKMAQTTLSPELRGGHLSRAQRREVLNHAVRTRERYLDIMDFGWYQVVYIFVIASVAGLVLEELWMFASEGVRQSRVGLVWGPFSPLYGVGAVALTYLGFALRRLHASAPVQFVVMAVAGGLIEQLAGWSMDRIFHAQSWTYLGLPDHITQWVSCSSMALWGLLGLVWVRLAMPDLLFRIGEPTTSRQVLFVTLLSAYLALDVFLTVSAFYMRSQRQMGATPQNAFETFIDEHYTDEWMANRFQNMVVGQQLPTAGLPGVNGTVATDTSAAMACTMPADVAVGSTAGAASGASERTAAVTVPGATEPLREEET
ncbi:putative ABC transporter permease [Olsenella massiliensis]|uniref:putative ABC transporter permease n=1 Tax=Olsenella massiliensis TaxID=1622075 RepID=UPI0009EC6AFA|nr:putative ABC transporter permease [Olsenella massiliensis]